VAAGTAGGSPAVWTGFGWRRVRPAPYLPQAVTRRTACDGNVVGADRLAHDLRGLRQVVGDDRFAGGCAPTGPLAVGFRDGPDAGLTRWRRSAHDPRLARSNMVASIRADLLRRAGRRDDALDWYREALASNGS